jgi:hypothetical protein
MEAIVIIPKDTPAVVRNAFYKEYSLIGYKAGDGDDRNHEFLVVFTTGGEHHRYGNYRTEYADYRNHPKAVVYGQTYKALLMMERLKPWKN